MASSKSRDFVVRRAVQGDAEFLSIGAREAERCHTGIGLYDSLVGMGYDEIGASDRAREDRVSRVLKHCLQDADSHIHISHFVIVCEAHSKVPVACAAAFPYPEFSVKNSMRGFNRAMKAELGYPPSACRQAWRGVQWLDSSFPEVDCNGSWMLDAVYVAPWWRGEGLGLRVVEAAVRMRMDCPEVPPPVLHQHYTRTRSHERGQEEVQLEQVRQGTMAGRRCMLACAIGNTGAQRIYEKAGFRVIGEGNSERCMQAIKCPGFNVMETDLAG
ncbi:hypothetical protein B484DRAFT_54187 [Ochromonadaceae sp. CCMP2298]|nr:hypothetical protein B484DRAFT_54187 [Ochromonadaceae sp. CCMP2298]|mmetsp:Transcript_32265/g.73480  ORF Transcript_32265/g.73480 Transcript_32265/m.73480 type:complete len:272 (+) Transcript_32265:60-875(+)